MKTGVGLIVGKFDPPHRGHSLIVDIATAHVERLVLAVWDFPQQTVPSATRAAWLREIHPDVDVQIVLDDPEAVDTKAWAAQILAHIDARPDMLFSSEAYGEQLARDLGAQHTTIDRDRRWIPCTGTMIRRAPLKYLKWLEPCVRAHYVKRVCVAGAESTGKTTLCKELALRFETNCIREYGRDYSVIKLGQGELDHWRSDEFLHIAREQQRMEDEAARSANRLLICDTDTLATRIWHEAYIERERDEWSVSRSKIALYLLPYPDVPYVPDEVRFNEHKRFWMFERFVKECEASGVPTLILRGDWDERREAAAAAIDALMGSE